MLGKVFQRIVKSWNACEGIDKAVESALLTVVGNMITEPQLRFSLRDVLPYLQEYLLNYEAS